MAHENTVLSLNPDRRALLSHESALQKYGFEIVSVSSPLQARFEIEMGRCGVFIASYITPQCRRSVVVNHAGMHSAKSQISQINFFMSFIPGGEIAAPVIDV
jgi:hypothetical protein